MHKDSDSNLAAPKPTKRSKLNVESASFLATMLLLTFPNFLRIPMVNSMNDVKDGGDGMRRVDELAVMTSDEKTNCGVWRKDQLPAVRDFMQQ